MSMILCLLDVCFRKLDGFGLISRFREFSDMPIVMLTLPRVRIWIKIAVQNMVQMIICKPFNILEVKSRIKAIMRRTAKRKKEERSRQSVLIEENMKIDCEGHDDFHRRT